MVWLGCLFSVFILSTSFVGVAFTTTSFSSSSSAAATMVSPPTDATLPRWDLNLRFGFASPFDPAIDQHLEETQKRAVQFQSDYEGKLNHTNNVSLLAAVMEYEAISVRRTTLSSYLSLHYDVDLENDELKKRKGAVAQKQSAVYGDHLEWFTLDLATMSPDDLEAQYAKDDGGLLKYKAFSEEVRRQRPHNLEKNVERALTVRAPYAGTRPLVSFMDKELSLMRFQLDPAGEASPVNLEVLLSRLSSSKDAQVRAECLHQLNEGLSGAVSRIASLSLSAVAGSWLIENKERNYASLRSRRNLDNNCPDEVVDSLLEAVRSAGVPLCKRYYALKKQILKQTQDLQTFRWSDRNAEIDIVKEKKDDKISWPDAVQMVERGYRKFSPRMAKMFTDMVDEKRIDVPAADGKKGGAYCAGVVPGIGPFQLLNFDGTKRDVATLAHESGHGCHDILAYQQGYLQYHPPLTLAETASIFGEMIVFRDLLELASTPEEKLSLLMSKIDDTINSAVRQCSFDRFEELAHNARENGELSTDELDGFWMQAMREYYGEPGKDSPFDAFDDSSHLWAYVPHFHHVPFYVYSYAFADLVVGTLYRSFQTNPDGFEDRLLDLLSAGGTRDFATALQPFGLDPASTTFWVDAINAHLGGLLEETEALAATLGFSDSCIA